MWDVVKYSKEGVRNQKQGLLCQDYVYYHEKDSVQSITLADGSGITDYARLGAEHTCKVLGILLTEHFNELCDIDKGLVQFNVITNIQTELYNLCEKYGVKISDLHSTLLGLAIDNDTDRFIAIHLGDGKIDVKSEGKIRTMSYPENGVNKSYTFLTSAHKVGSHIRVFRGGLKDITEFVLMSDGWNEKMKGRNQVFSKDIFSLAEERQYIDDVSLIALIRQ